MIYGFTLQSVGIAAALALVFGHAVAWFGGSKSVAVVRAFPRSRAAGTVLIVAAAVWGFWLAWTIDLGEFSGLRNKLLVAIVVLAFLSWRYVQEFLAVRALGMLLLLASEPLLESAVLRDESSRVLLVLLAYAWVAAGLFFVGMPYLLRDAITWISQPRWKWGLACIGGVAYGLVLLVCAIAFW